MIYYFELHIKTICFSSLQIFYIIALGMKMQEKLSSEASNISDQSAWPRPPCRRNARWQTVQWPNNWARNCTAQVSTVPNHLVTPCFVNVTFCLHGEDLSFNISDNSVVNSIILLKLDHFTVILIVIFVRYLSRDISFISFMLTNFNVLTF